MLLTGAHSFLKLSSHSLLSLLFSSFLSPFLISLSSHVKTKGRREEDLSSPVLRHTRHSGPEMFVKKKRTGEEGYWTFAPLLPLSTTHKPILCRASLSRRLSLFVRRRQVPSQTPRDDDLPRYNIFFPRRNIILEEKCFGARRVGPIARAMTSLRGKSTFWPGGLLLWARLPMLEPLHTLLYP